MLFPLRVHHFLSLHISTKTTDLSKSLLFEAFKVKESGRQTEEASARQEEAEMDWFMFYHCRWYFSVRVQTTLMNESRLSEGGRAGDKVEGETKIKSADNPAQTQGIDSSWDWSTQKYINTWISNTAHGLSLCLHSFDEICRYIAAAKSAVTWENFD